MSYVLSFDESPAGAVEAVRRSQLEAAAAGLREAPTDAEAIHDARKRLKKTRALLRLTRPAMKRKAFRRRNRALRDAGRALSAARDAEVLTETVGELADRYPGRAAYGPVHVALADRTAEPEGSAATLEPLVAAGWELDGLCPDVFAEALLRTYVRGREAFAVADREPTGEHLHEWRKRVKDLWYQQRLLEETWPGVMKAQAKEAKKLSKLLGEDHDLAVLSETLNADPSLAGHADAFDVVIAKRRKKLLKRSRRLGRRVFAEKPKAFAKRFNTYLELV
jgi:CHAD domain-containing protein